jgi:hypothetical protein
VTTITFAERAGRLVPVARVPAGLACGCVCPACGGAMVARKGRVKRHHFAHAIATACHGETVLHEVGKRLLHDRIARHLRRGRPLPIGWRCDVCRACGVRTGAAHLSDFAPALTLSPRLHRGYVCPNGCP